MPWRDSSPMDLKTQFVADYLRQILSISELSRQYNISRKTAYKWIDRYLEEGSSGLVERSRRPLVCPHQTPTKLVEALLEARRHHPTWGAKKLLKILSDRQPNSAWPSRKMIVVELLLINRYSHGLLSEAPNARINRRAIKIELKNQANCESG